jgi:hypothetical protein
MRIEILSEAEDDLLPGAKFYERKRAGLGEYFLARAAIITFFRCRPPSNSFHSNDEASNNPAPRWAITLIGSIDSRSSAQPSRLVSAVAFN